MHSLADAVSHDRVLVIIPTYNERDNVLWIWERLHAAVPGVDLLIVDDASPDGTGGVAAALSVREPAVHVLHGTGKRGLGRAYLSGFAWALARGYAFVVEMDADGSHAPEELPRLLAEIRYADLVLGSRWVTGGSTTNWSRGRRLLSQGGNAWTRLLLGMPLHDVTGGFRVYRREVLEALCLSEVTSEGYCFQVDMARRSWAAGFRVSEVPITFADRTRGNSKMSRRIVLEAFWRVTCWGLSKPLDATSAAARRDAAQQQLPAAR